MIKKSFKTFLYLAIFFFLSQFAYALNVVKLSPGYYPNSSRGSALSSADIYVGKPDLDPEIIANQKTLSVQQEDGTITTVSQPIHTNAGGVPQYAGSPITLLVEGDYSLKVLDSNGIQIYYIPSTAYEKYLIEGNYYYPDYAEADQGVAGGGETVTDILTEVGAVTKATMYFSHNSGAATTTYTFTTSTAILSNYNIIVEKGAIFAGTVTFGAGSIKEVHPEWWGPNTTPGTTDMTAEIQAAINSITTGDVVFYGETYLISAPLIPESYVNWKGVGGTIIKLANATDDDMLDFTGTNTDIIIESIEFDGNGTNQTGGVGTNIIHATTQIKKLTITNCILKNSAAAGIRLDGSLAHEDIIISENKFIDYESVGITFYGVIRGTISDNILNNTGVTPAANGNGISISVVSSDVTVSGNTITMGEAGAASFGIETGSSGNVSTRISITGNTVHCGNYTNHGGISMSYTDQGTISGNIIYQAKNIGSIEVSLCTIVSVTGNSIRDSAVAAIAVTNENNAISVIGNTIDDFDTYGIVANLGAGTQANFYGITINGNTISNGNGAAGNHSIYVNKAPSHGLTISGNTLYSNSSATAINVIADTGVTCTGFVIANNSIYGHDKWISIGGTGTHVDHIIMGNNISTCPTAATFAGTGLVVKNNAPDTEIITGAYGDLNRYMSAGEIDSSGGVVSGNLRNGYFIGQIKIIVMTEASNSSTITVTYHDDIPGNPVYVGSKPAGDYEVATFDAVDEAWILMWTGTEWTTLRATCTFV